MCDCGEYHFHDLADNGDLTTQFMRMAAQVWKDQGVTAGTINRAVTRAIASKLWNGVLQGYGLDPSAVDYNTPDWNMLAALRKNVWHFSAAKNYAELRELGAALIGEDGKLRSRSAFMEAAGKINDQYNKHWMAAEYELAVSGGQMAGKWIDIERNAASMPFIEFDAVLDSQTTSTCRMLDGVIVRWDHPYVKRYYPPNHFGCRTTVRQRTGGIVTADHLLPYPETPKMFQVNLGQDRLIFPNDHPYFINTPAGIESQGMSAFRKQLYTESKVRLKGKIVDVEGLGEVGFSGDGIKEMFNQPHKDYMYKNQLAGVSDLMLKNASVVSTSADITGKALNYHYLSVSGLQGNYLVVKEFADGRKILYSIVDSLK